MGGQATLPYLAPAVGPGLLTFTLNVTSEGAQTGSGCSHSTEAEVASIVPPSGRHERLLQRIVEALKQVNRVQGGTF